MRWSTALVTGGSTGIGFSLAKALVAEGTKVVICGRRQEQLDQAIAELGANASAIQCDVSDPSAVKVMVDEAHRRLGSLDLVIANAGVGGDRSALKVGIDDVIPMLKINVLGACATIVSAIPHQLAAGKGHLVGVTSLAGYRGLPTGAAYSASKAAFSTFLESVRVDLFRKNIKVTDIRPGFVETPLTKKNKFKMPFLMTSDRAATRILGAIARGRRVYAFPLPTWLGMRVLMLIPAWLYDRLGSRMNVRKDS
jgi:NAD(P)-dependent dehydrogenase (short-subunit alcohol dehydrogenase family)